MLRGMAVKDSSLIPRVQNELVEVNKSPLLSSYGKMFIANTMEISADHLKDKLELNESVLRFIPIGPVVYHQALLLALSDEPEKAKKQMEQAIWAYPKDYPVASAELTEMVRKDPARFSPLLEFATQKIEEYRSAAISAK